MGLRFVQHGEPMRRGGAFVGNHSSWIDIVVLQRAAAPFLVSKAEVRGWPVIGQIGRAIGTMFIDRRPAEAKRQEAELFARLVRGDQMAIFPEGTSSDGQRILPFKSALFGVFFAPEVQGSVAVQPVTIRYRRGRTCRRASMAGGGRWSSRGTSATCWRGRRGGVVEVTFHPPLRAADFAGRKAMAERAEAVVAGVFGAG